MAEPEETPEAGTGTEEVAPETTEEAPIVETPADESADDDVDEPEVGTQDHEAKGETAVPYTRFKSVNERRKAAEAERDELKAKLAALTPKEEAKPESPKARIKGLTPAPADVSNLDALELYALETLEKHPEVLDAWFAKKFGMPADAAAATLSYSATNTQASIRADFEKACGERGLDPKSPAVRDAVGRLMDSKQYRSFGEAMDVLRPAPKPNGNNGKAPQNKKPTPPGPESSGVEVDGLTRVVKTILSKEEAMALAEKGVRAPQKSITEILAAK